MWSSIFSLQPRPLRIMTGVWSRIPFWYTFSPSSSQTRIDFKAYSSVECAVYTFNWTFSRVYFPVSCIRSILYPYGFNSKRLGQELLKEIVLFLNMENVYHKIVNCEVCISSKTQETDRVRGYRWCDVRQCVCEV